MWTVALAVLGLLPLPITWTAQVEPDHPTEAVEPRFVLTPSPSVPSAASGTVELGGHAGGVTTLSIKVQQLPPGLYWLVGVSKSDGAAVRLAPLSVSDSPDYEPDRQANSNPKQRTNAHQAQVLEIQALVHLPADIALTEIAQLRIEDVQGSVWLTGAPLRGR